MTLRAWRRDSVYFITEKCPKCGISHIAPAISVRMTTRSHGSIRMRLQRGPVPRAILNAIYCRGYAATINAAKFIALPTTGSRSVLSDRFSLPVEAIRGQE